MAATSTAAIERSKLFDVITASYKAIDNQPISVDVQIPKIVKHGKHPLLVRFHGGGLITGASMFMGFYAPWIMDYAIAHEAIVVSPNYRLLPESTGLEIMDDLSDFWKWTKGGLQPLVSSNTEGQVEVDLSKILVQGESAGGYLALQSGLMYSSPRIKAVVASYPMIDMKSPWFNQSKEKLMFNIPMLPEAFLNDHLATIHAGGIVTSADPPDRLNLMFAIIQQRRILEFLGKDPSLFPLETIESVKMFPPLFIYHGRDDSVVPAEGTEKFVEKFTQNLPEAKLVFKLEPGEHGMDHETDIKEPWLQQGLELVTVEWLA